MVDFTEGHRARMIEALNTALKGNKISATRTPRFAPVIEEDNRVLEECKAAVTSWATSPTPKK